MEENTKEKFQEHIEENLIAYSKVAEELNAYWQKDDPTRSEYEGIVNRYQFMSGIVRGIFSAYLAVDLLRFMTDEQKTFYKKMLNVDFE